MSAAKSLQTIVVPTDFSRGARRALQRVAHLPLAARAKVHLVHVVDDRGFRPRKGEAQRAIERAKSLLSASSRGTTMEILTGTPHVEIIRYARSVDADLIVLGRKGAGQRIGQVLGSTAARVAHKCDLPVLVVGPAPKGPYRKPLLAMEFDLSMRALVKLTRTVVGPRLKSIACVHAFHVPFEGLISGGSDANPYHRQIRDEVEKRLEAFLKSANIRSVRLRGALQHGEPPQVILAHARREDADLIAVGTHGRGGIAHAIIGSVAESVVIGATRDVLIARPVRFTFDEA
jgi:nucleotide-binding universal stress UspA family protein